MTPLPAKSETVARIVADHWREAAMEWGDDPMPGRVAAHPLCMVLAALDGETDPRQLGIPEGPAADAIREAVTPADAPREACGRGICAKHDGHEGPCDY